MSEKDNEKMDNWKKTGAFCVQFVKDGHPVEVIVDDYIALKGDGTPCFSMGGPKGLECWVTILEKAYAKLFGSYEFIEAGKIPLALADMNMDGFPEEEQLKQMKGNPAQFWDKILSLMEVKAMLGAGSPEAAGGDSVVSDNGIVQNHAYAILDCKQFEG